MAKIKPWGGRFSASTHRLTEQFTLSVQYDQRLALCDLLGSKAHVKGLQRARVISAAEAKKILGGLSWLETQVRAQKIKWDAYLEDVHMNLEVALVKRVGPVGKKVHTGRSRNDQVLTDVRLYVKSFLSQLMHALVAVQAELVKLAEKYADVAMPGFTHMQHAQPVLLAHHLLAYVEMFLRDVERFASAYDSADVLVLGSAALAGTAYPIDREWLAKELGFSRVSQNSMDAVADRDFVADTLYACAMLGVHLSRLGEELVLWSSSEFDFVRIGAAFTTGSSIMPQKKNPDVAELLRGKSGRLVGNLMTMLTLLKSLPLTYNRDLQEDKEPLFDSLDTCLLSLQVLAGMLPTLKFNTKRLQATAVSGFAAATDLADALVKKGLPFRDAHEVVGKVVAYCEKQNKIFEDLSAGEWKQVLGAQAKRLSPKECSRVIQVDAVLAARNVTGGTAPGQVKRQLKSWRKGLVL